MGEGTIDMSQYIGKGRKSSPISETTAGDPELAAKKNEEMLAEKQRKELTNELKKSNEFKKKYGVKQITTGVLLADAIKAMVSRSKVLNTLLEHISSALSLLLDLILLPFLPLLVYGIVQLYNAVIGLGKIWNEYISKKDIAGAVVTGPAAATQAVVGPVGFDIGRWIGENFTDKIIQSLIDGFWKFVGGIQLIWDALVDTLKDWWDKLVNIISSAWDTIYNKFDANFIKPLINAIDSLKSGLIGMINWVIDKINTILPTGFKISPLASPAKMGDMGLPKPFTAPQITAEINITGLTQEDLPGRIMEELRQLGSRSWL